MGSPDELGRARLGGLDRDDLESCLNHLISLLALPSLCQGRSPAEILDLSLDALEPLLGFDLAYVKLNGAGGLEAVRGAGMKSIDASAVRDFASRYMSMPLPSPGIRVDGPAAMGPMHLAAVPLGFYADAGVLVLAARRRGFPGPNELIQLRAAAGLIASALEDARTREGLEQARAELEAANRAKDEFLAMLGHELRNPLAPIVSALQLMKVEPQRSARARDIIERQVEHMRQLVDDLLDVSRITRGAIELKKQWVALSEVLDSAIDTVRPLILQRNHALEVRCDVGDTQIYVDRTRAAQIVGNLLNNAAKYTEPGGQIRLDVSIHGDNVAICVRDTGIGISAEMLSQIFGVFVQEKRALHRAEGGLGLGLGIVKSLVELHGGTVVARSPGLGQGSEFVVHLPRAAGASPPEPAGSCTVVNRQCERQRTPYILIVDDNQDAAELLAEVMTLLGYRIDVANDGPSALHQAQLATPDVVLMDLGLPGMDGYELAERFRMIPALHATHLVAITGYGQDSDRRRSAAAGFFAHLVKPVDTVQLREVLDQLSMRDASGPPRL